MEIIKESVREFAHGHTSVGKSRKKLSELTFHFNKGILLRCPGEADVDGNDAPVWVGGVGVTADATETGGIPILPGDSMFVPIERPDLLYVISTEDDQDIAWIGL